MRVQKHFSTEDYLNEFRKGKTPRINYCSDTLNDRNMMILQARSTFEEEKKMTRLMKKEALINLYTYEYCWDLCINGKVEELRKINQKYISTNALIVKHCSQVLKDWLERERDVEWYYKNLKRYPVRVEVYKKYIKEYKTNKAKKLQLALDLYNLNNIGVVKEVPRTSTIPMIRYLTLQGYLMGLKAGGVQAVKAIKEMMLVEKDWKIKNYQKGALDAYQKLR
jgi:hypothetical protein